MLDVCEDFDFRRETAYLAINYVDRFLSSSHSVSKKALQLTATTSIWIAHKIEETFLIPMEHLLQYTVNSFEKTEIVKMEKVLIGILNWRLNPVTIESFLNQ